MANATQRLRNDIVQLILSHYLLEAIAEKYINNRELKGKIELFTERAM